MMGVRNRRTSLAVWTLPGWSITPTTSPVSVDERVVALDAVVPLVRCAILSAVRLVRVRVHVEDDALVVFMLAPHPLPADVEQTLDQRPLVLLAAQHRGHPRLGGLRGEAVRLTRPLRCTKRPVCAALGDCDAEGRILQESVGIVLVWPLRTAGG